MENRVEAAFTAKDLKLFKEVCAFIARCEPVQAAVLVNEVLMLHPILAWNPVTKSLDSIESVSVNGDGIQLNIEEYEDVKPITA